MHVLELSGGQSESKYHARASRWLSKKIKLPMSQPESLHVYIESYNHPVLPSLTANYACPPVVCDHCTLRSSELVVPTSSAPLLTNQHENADVSFIDLRSYIPEISWVRSSKLPPLLRGGDYHYYLLSLLCSFIYNSQKHLTIDDGARCNKFCQASCMAHVFSFILFQKKSLVKWFSAKRSVSHKNKNNCGNRLISLHHRLGFYIVNGFVGKCENSFSKTMK